MHRIDWNKFEFESFQIVGYAPFVILSFLHSVGIFIWQNMQTKRNYMHDSCSVDVLLWTLQSTNKIKKTKIIMGFMGFEMSFNKINEHFMDFCAIQHNSLSFLVKFSKSSCVNKMQQCGRNVRILNFESWNEKLV